MNKDFKHETHRIQYKYKHFKHNHIEFHKEYIYKISNTNHIEYYREYIYKDFKHKFAFKKNIKT